MTNAIESLETLSRTSEFSIHVYSMYCVPRSRKNSHAQSLIPSPCILFHPLRVPLLSLPAWLLSAAAAQRRRRARGKRESGRGTVTQAEGPHQTPLPQGTHHSGTNPSSPAPQHHGGTARTAPHIGRSKPCSGRWLRPAPQPPTPRSQHCHIHLAFLHCCDTRALSLHAFHCPHCCRFIHL